MRTMNWRPSLVFGNGLHMTVPTYSDEASVKTALPAVGACRSYVSMRKSGNRAQLCRRH